MPEKPLRTITVDELLPEELALTADPEKFKQHLKNKGLQLPPPPAGGDAGKRLIRGDKGQYEYGAKEAFNEAMHANDGPGPKRITETGPFGLKYQRPEIPDDRMPTFVGSGTMPKSFGKFVQGAAPGMVAGIPGGPLGMALGGVVGGAINSKVGPDPTTARAVAETLINTATAALPVGRMNSAIAAIPGSQEWLKKLAMFGANAVVGGASTAAANEAGNQAARMSGEMQGPPANINVLEAIGGAALANGALGVIGGAGRMIANRLPQSVRNQVTPLLRKLELGMDDPRPPDPAFVQQLEQRAAQGDATAQFQLGQLQRGAPVAPPASRPQGPPTPPMPMGPPTPPPPQSMRPPMSQQMEPPTLPPAASTPVTKAAPAPPKPPAPEVPPPAPMMAQQAPQAPVPPPAPPMPPPAPPAMGGAVPEPQSDMERLLAESIKARQAGQVPRPQAPPTVQPNPNLARGVTPYAQNEFTQALEKAGMDPAEIAVYAKALEENPAFRRKISQSGIPMPGSSSKPEGVLGTGNPEAGAAPLGEPLVNAVNAAKGAAEEVGNAWRDWGMNRNKAPVVEDRAIADKMYQDYANLNKFKNPGEARTALDKMINGDPVEFLRTMDSGGPELKDAARTRVTEKLLEAFRGFDEPGAESLNIMDKFHQMRRAEVGGGTTGGEVLRKVFGKDAIHNIEGLYDALEKSRNLPSQQSKDGSGLHPSLRLLWNNKGPALRVFAPAGMLGASALASVPAAAGAAAVGATLGATLEFGPAALGRLLASKDSRRMNFLVDMIENSGKFTTAQIGQYLAGLAGMADRVEPISEPQQ